MKIPQLDNRLQTVADQFTACDVGADIGADHGRLSCYLLSTDRCKKMIVADISAPSLEKAKRLLDTHDLTDRAVFKVADGLNALREMKADTIAICGMGGNTISEILHQGVDYLRGARLILSAHTDLPFMRRAVMECGYHIGKEIVAYAAGRYYMVLVCEEGTLDMTDKQLYVGMNHQYDDPLYGTYLKWRVDVVNCEYGAIKEMRLSWLKEEQNHVISDNAAHQ